jgi:hypothetical protein
LYLTGDAPIGAHAAEVALFVEVHHAVSAEGEQVADAGEWTGPAFFYRAARVAAVADVRRIAAFAWLDDLVAAFGIAADVWRKALAARETTAHTGGIANLTWFAGAVAEFDGRGALARLVRAREEGLFFASGGTAVVADTGAVVTFFFANYDDAVAANGSAP